VTPLRVAPTADTSHRLPHHLLPRRCPRRQQLAGPPARTGTNKTRRSRYHPHQTNRITHRGGAGTRPPPAMPRADASTTTTQPAGTSNARHARTHQHPQNNTKAAEGLNVKPIEASQQAHQRDGVGGQPQPRPIVTTLLGRLTLAAGVASMALAAFHHPYASTPSPAAVIWADPPSPGATGNPDEQPRRVCTHWDPQNNTTQDQPCDRPS
jgi:hypothetical protein